MTMPNPERDAELVLLVRVPYFGRETMEPSAVEAVERILQTGLHGKAEISHLITVPKGAAINVLAELRKPDDEGPTPHSNGETPDLYQRSRFLRWLPGRRSSVSRRGRP